MNPLAAARVFGAPNFQPLPLPASGDQTPLARIPYKELEAVPSTLDAAAAGKTQPAFGNLVSHLVGEVNQKQNAASSAVSGLLSGNNVSLHQAMIAMEEASVSFQLMVEVRNKLLESYQELMRMQL